MPAALHPVAAYVMHEEEELAAHDILKKHGELEATRTVVMGHATEAEIAELRGKGILVRELDEEAAPTLKKISFGLESVSLAGMEVFSAGERTVAQRFLLRLRGPMLEPRRAALAQRGLRVVEALPRDAYKVELRPDQVEDVTALPYVVELEPERQVGGAGLESLGMYFESGLEAEPPQAKGPGTEWGEAQAPYDLWLRDGTDAKAFAAQLAEKDYVIVGAEGQKVRVMARRDSDQLRELKMMAPVEIVEEFVPPQLHNVNARGLLGLGAPANPGTPLPWTGKGQIVGVADTGLDQTHPDFQQPGKLAAPPRDLGRPGQTDDPHGHGTHVAGSVLGDGAASGGQLRGAAPDASLFFQSVLGHPQPNNKFPLTGLPVALGTLFEEAYQAGARVHNNSWGAFAASYYRLSSREVDQYVRHVRRDMLVVISAGNDGTTYDPLPPGQRRSAAGSVDWYSLGAPATSKNALVVGASQSDLSGVGYGRHTHAAIWPNRFQKANVPGDIADELISGAPEEMAGFSSRGPTDVLQVKPDVVAPGTDIASARSALAPRQHFSATHAGFPQHYGHMCGTSMAAPLVSGCAALVRQYLSEEEGYSQPSAALVKAILINGTRRLTGTHSNASPGGFPNSHQGFGRVDMSHSLPNPADKTFDLCYYDNWQDQNTHLTINDRQRFTFTLAAGVPWLRLCLAYTDLPGRAVQNVLFLQLHHTSGPPTNKWYGNQGQMPDLQQALFTPDRHNNVSIIRVENPPAGQYMIQVAPTNMPFGGLQDFALAVSGAGVATHFRVNHINN